MNRYDAYYPRDTAPQRDGDAGFVGVDERLDPALLPPGFVASAKNCRFRNGQVETRGGDTIWPWMRDDGMTKFGTVFCATTFSDPIDGTEWIVIAADTGVWATCPNNVAKSVSLPGGVTLTAATAVQMVQCFNVLVLLRGPEAAPLVCANGLDAGFTAITQTASGSGTETIPNSAFGLFFANRLLLVHERDQLAASDALDYTRYAPTLANFRINQGDNDALVAVSAFNESTLIMLKDQSVWRVDNVYGDLSQITLRKVTSQYGCIAPRSVVQYGTNLAWFSERGVETIKLTELNQIQGRSVSLSDKLTKTLERINWKYANGICGSFWNGKLYFAVPLDDANVVDTATNLLAGAVYANPGLAGSDATSPLYNLVPGTQYRYQQSTNDHYAIVSNNSQFSLYNGDCYLYGPELISPPTYYAVFLGAVQTVCTATLNPVLITGVNTAVLVFDTDTNEWCGVDERPGMNIKEWVQFTHQGIKRLGYISTLGELHLYEEGGTDEAMLPVPSSYTDLIVNFTPDYTQLQFNGGTIVTTDGNPTNSGSTWGTGSSSAVLNSNVIAQTNLWRDANNKGGYDQTATLPWSVGGVTTNQIASGVRVFSTTLSINTGAGLTPVTSRGYYGVSQLPGFNSLYVDPHSGTEIQPVPITTQFTSRGYRAENVDRKRFKEMAVRVSTWSPTYSFTMLTDGVGETASAIANRTRSRTQYYTAAAAYDPTNINNDWGNPYRQDYSVVPDSAGVSLGTGDGINFSQTQDAEERLAIDERGITMQLQVTNTAGTIAIKSVTLACDPGQRSYDTRA